MGTPLQFDIMAQLANIFARITLYELLQLSKETRDVLGEAFADSGSLEQIAEPSISAEDSCLHCH